MSTKDKAHFYPAAEEKINILSHAAGLILSVVGLIFLLLRAAQTGDAKQIISCGVFGLSLTILYAASTTYHRSKTAALRQKLRTIDHASIYVLIAGTYTPFALLILRGTVGWTIFVIAWGMALTGIIIKLFFTGRFNHVSTGMYVFMGWLIVFAYEPLIANFSTEGLSWLFAGGVSYTLGALFYSINRLPFAHATFHVFVLIGSACHFVCVYQHVLLLPA